MKFNRLVFPLFYLKHRGQLTAVLCGDDTSRFKVRVDSSDIFLIWEIYRFRIYDDPVLPIRADDTVVDIGAHIGVFTTRAAQRATRGRVIAYEASKNNFNLLADNVALNNLENVSINHKAVFFPAGKLTFNQPDGNGALGSALQEESEHAEEVEAVTLDDIYDVNNLDRIDFLKLDAEGAEYPILYNASPSALNGIRRMVLEYHEFPGLEWDHAHLAAYLESAGFKVQIEGGIPGQRWLFGTGVIRAWRPDRSAT
jgi:FkbM family methyltransferase